VVVDHDMSRRVGFVRELFEHQDVDGPWLAALVTIEHPPAWLERGTAASISYHGSQRQAIGESERIFSGLIPEISILSPSRKPAEPGAQVATFRRAEAPAPAAGEEIIWGAAKYGGSVIKRDQGHDAAWMDELQRRMGWIERRTGRQADMEVVMAGMRREIHGPTLDELYLETYGRRVAA
jgi:hypothetical protein